MSWFKLKDVKNVAIRPFIPSRQEGNSWEIEPHRSFDVPVGVVLNLSVPKGVNAIRLQAIGQTDVRYTMSPNSDPSVVSGFALIGGNDPIIIPIVNGATEIKFYAEGAGAHIESQLGTIF